MMQQIRGQRRNLARQLYRRTNRLPFFSVNELRDTKLDRFFNDPREHGAFFTDLMVDGFIVQVGETVATHPKARGRMVKKWKWTNHAKQHLRPLMGV